MNLLKSFALEKKDELVANSTFEENAFTASIHKFTSIKEPNHTSFYNSFKKLIQQFMLSQKNLL